MHDINRIYFFCIYKFNNWLTKFSYCIIFIFSSDFRHDIVSVNYAIRSIFMWRIVLEYIILAFHECSLYSIFLRNTRECHNLFNFSGFLWIVSHLWHKNDHCRWQTQFELWWFHIGNHLFVSRFFLSFCWFFDVVEEIGISI